MLAELDRTGADQISLTHPDARAMARMTKVGVGYNIQLAVDVKHKLIAERRWATRSSTWAFTRRPRQRQWNRSASNGSRPSPTGVTSSRISRPRGGRVYDLCAQANPRSRRPRGLLRQGRVPLRACPGRLCLPGRGSALAALQGQVTRQCEGRLCQPRCLPGVRAEIALHSVIPPRLASGERGRSRPHGGPVGGQARDAGPPAKHRRAPPSAPSNSGWVRARS